MKILSSDFRKGFCKLKVENLDDLWYLNQIIECHDLVKGKTFRKIKIGSETQRKQSVSKKPVFLEIDVIKAEYSATTSALRISGIIKKAPEEIPLGSHHTFSIEEGTVITIIKQKWLRFQIDKLKDASKQPSKILICVHDREEAIFALIKKYGYQVMSKMKGMVVKKNDLNNQKHVNFYKEIIEKICEYDERYSPSKIIIASPAFWKEDLMKEMSEGSIKDKIILATSSSADENAVGEVIKRPETENALKQDRVTKEYKYVDELFKEISKDNLSSYGMDDTIQAAQAGAIKILLITDNLIMKSRAEDSYEKIESVTKLADSSNSEIIVVSSEHEAGKKLDGLGGIAAILRYKIKY
jgi:protein pelota